MLNLTESIVTFQAFGSTKPRSGHFLSNFEGGRGKGSLKYNFFCTLKNSQ